MAPADNFSVARRIGTLRLPRDLHSGLSRFIAEHSVTPTQGVRMLLRVALADHKSAFDTQKAAIGSAYREGYLAALTKLRGSLGRTIAEILEELEREQG